MKGRSRGCRLCVCRPRAWRIVGTLPLARCNAPTKADLGGDCRNEGAQPLDPPTITSTRVQWSHWSWQERKRTDPQNNSAQRPGVEMNENIRLHHACVLAVSIKKNFFLKDINERLNPPT